MPRKPRAEVAGGVHHVFARGIDRRAIYADDLDRRRYLAIMGRVVPWRRWRCLAYCLMPNHVHLMLETPRPNLGSGMQYLHGTYADEFNKRHGRSGHVFQGRYGSVLITTDEQLWHVAAYIALNPVAAGLCGRPEEWPWSSYAATIGLRESPAFLDSSWILERFGEDLSTARRTFRDFVQAALVSETLDVRG
jgi:putative transposase